MAAALLIALSLAVPVAMLLACLSRHLRERMPALLALAPVPGLAAALLASGAPPLVFDQTGLQFTLALDRPGSMLLGAAALLWIAAGTYARTYLRGRPDGGRFAVWWLLSLTGSLGVFMAADMASFYVFFGMASLAAWGLVIHDGAPATLRAGAIYLGLAVLAEICLLMAFALLAAAGRGHGVARVADGSRGGDPRSRPVRACPGLRARLWSQIGLHNLLTVTGRRRIDR